MLGVCRGFFRGGQYVRFAERPCGSYQAHPGAWYHAQRSGFMDFNSYSNLSYGHTLNRDNLFQSGEGVINTWMLAGFYKSTPLI